MAQKPMTVSQMMQAYQQLTRDYQSKQIDRAGYSAALINLRAMDSEGRWWTCTKNGGFLWYDGKRWLPGKPAVSSLTANPSQSSKQAAPTSANAKPAKALKTKSPSNVWRKIASTPILAMLPGAIIGGIWFLYTLLQVILDGFGDVDLLTPLILTGVPLLLWLVRKPLDKLLLPLQKFPFALRMGSALAVPMLLGCGCSAISTSGYSAMHFTALISTLLGYFLLHTPTSKNIS